MGGDVASLAAEMTPYVSAAAAAYGGAVLARVRDDAADATVGLGRRLLQRVFGTRGRQSRCPGRWVTCPPTRRMMMRWRRCAWRSGRRWPLIRYWRRMYGRCWPVCLV